jgi:hypothetical protein
MVRSCNKIAFPRYSNSGGELFVCIFSRFNNTITCKISNLFLIHSIL